MIHLTLEPLESNIIIIFPVSLYMNQNMVIEYQSDCTFWDCKKSNQYYCILMHTAYSVVDQPNQNIQGIIFNMASGHRYHCFVTAKDYRAI
jgi:hypothetical protein